MSGAKAIVAISVYITDTQYNMVRVDPSTTCETICSSVVKKRNLDPSQKYCLVLEFDEELESKLHPKDSILEILSSYRQGSEDNVRVVLKPSEGVEEESEGEEEDSDDEDMFGGLDSEEGSEFQGVLMKRGELNKSWKERFFEIQKGELVYRKGPKGRRRGTIPLREAVITMTPREKPSSGRFMIRVPDTTRVFHLKAANYDQMVIWIEALRSRSEVVQENMSIDVIGGWIQRIESIQAEVEERHNERITSLDAAIASGKEGQLISEFSQFLESRTISNKFLKFCEMARDLSSAKDKRTAGKETLSTYLSAITSFTQRKGRASMMRMAGESSNVEEEGDGSNDGRKKKGGDEEDIHREDEWKATGYEEEDNSTTNMDAAGEMILVARAINALPQRGRGETRKLSQILESGDEAALGELEELLGSLSCQVYQILEPCYSIFIRKNMMAMRARWAPDDTARNIEQKIIGGGRFVSSGGGAGSSSSKSSSSSSSSSSSKSDEKDRVARAAISAIRINPVSLKKETKRACARARSQSPKRKGGKNRGRRSKRASTTPTKGGGATPPALQINDLPPKFSRRGSYVGSLGRRSKVLDHMELLKASMTLGRNQNNRAGSKKSSFDDDDDDDDDDGMRMEEGKGDGKKKKKHVAELEMPDSYDEEWTEEGSARSPSTSNSPFDSNFWTGGWERSEIEEEESKADGSSGGPVGSHDGGTTAAPTVATAEPDVPAVTSINRKGGGDNSTGAPTLSNSSSSSSSCSSSEAAASSSSSSSSVSGASSSTVTAPVSASRSTTKRKSSTAGGGSGMDVISEDDGLDAVDHPVTGRRNKETSSYSNAPDGKTGGGSGSSRLAPTSSSTSATATGKKNREASTTATSSSRKKWGGGTIFDDDQGDDDDDLFGSVRKKDSMDGKGSSTATKSNVGGRGEGGAGDILGADLGEFLEADDVLKELGGGASELDADGLLENEDEDANANDDLFAGI